MVRASRMLTILMSSMPFYARSSFCISQEKKRDVDALEYYSVSQFSSLLLMFYWQSRECTSSPMKKIGPCRQEDGMCSPVILRVGRPSNGRSSSSCGDGDRCSASRWRSLQTCSASRRRSRTRLMPQEKSINGVHIFLFFFVVAD